MQGFTYPLEVINGSVRLTDDYPTLVRGAILSSLNTELEERLYRPEYGLNTPVFDAVSNLTHILSTCRQAIALGLEDYPDVDFELRGFIDDSGTVLLAVVYKVSDTFEGKLEVAV